MKDIILELMLNIKRHILHAHSYSVQEQIQSYLGCNAHNVFLTFKKVFSVQGTWYSPNETLNNVHDQVFIAT